jgi:hypothetical protein
MIFLMATFSHICCLLDNTHFHILLTHTPKRHHLREEQGQTVNPLLVKCPCRIVGYPVPRLPTSRLGEESAADRLFGATGENHALDADSGLFCVWRYNPGSPNSCYGHAIPVYRLPGGYMLQLNPEYCFSPQEMAAK